MKDYISIKFGYCQYSDGEETISKTIALCKGNSSDYVILSEELNRLAPRKEFDRMVNELLNIHGAADSDSGYTHYDEVPSLPVCRWVTWFIDLA